MNSKKRGFVHLYTGNGKGKTTAALGLAVRASGHGLKAYIGQFMKGVFYGEIEGLRGNTFITIEQYGDEDCVCRDSITEVQIKNAKKGLEKAKAALISSRYDLVVLDEVNVAIYYGLLSTEEVLAVIDIRPDPVELILTGRYAPEALIEKADLVTEMKDVKHYYEKGVSARDGIER